MDDLVSIIITNYKKEEFLVKAIESCLSQTHQNIEVLVIDDASDSGALGLLKTLKDDRLRFICTSTNYGHYACCNYAIDQSFGDFVTFLGADDIIDRDHIEYLLSNLILGDFLAVLSRAIRYDITGQELSPPVLCEASILFRKQEIVGALGYFHMVRAAADSEFRLRIKKFFGHRVGHLNRVTYRALETNNGITKKGKYKMGSIERENYVRWFRDFHKTSELDKLFYDYKSPPGDVPSHCNFDINTFKEENLK